MVSLGGRATVALVLIIGTNLASITTAAAAAAAAYSSTLLRQQQQQQQQQPQQANDTITATNWVQSFWDGKGRPPSTRYGQPPTVPLGFYYDYFAGRDAPTNAAAVPQPQTAPSRTTVEVAFGGNVGNWPVSIAGSGTSVKLRPASLCQDPSECLTTANVESALQHYSYVHIDEVSATNPCPECAGVIKAIGDAGYMGRIIVFFRIALGGGGLAAHSDLVSLAEQGYVRKIYFETYPSSHNQCTDYLCTSTAATANAKLTTWSQLFASTFAGSNPVFAPAFGIVSNLDLDDCPADMDGVRAWFAAQHQVQPDWKGAAFYGASECTGCASYSVADAAGHFAALLAFWNGK